ncbi:acetolactate decarboxylase [Microbacterium testaceum]|uniref:acetolactate decarboxylase n=1 Tax=Microbacterium testaceum TaxID=2033 RepID=UPI00343551AA
MPGDIRPAAVITPGVVTQFAALDALLGGLYSTGITVGDARALGDTGIGCCERFGGEVIVLDGEFFACTTDGPPRRMSDDETMPFLDMCSFGKPLSRAVRDLDGPALAAEIDGVLVSRNLFHAIRLDGVVARVRTRLTPREQPPFRRLAEVTAEQIETVSHDVRGTVVGFWMPGLYQGITVAGLHLHFLSEDRALGGHVLEISIREAVLRVSAYARFALHLPTDDEFLSNELTHDEDRRIGAIEGGASRSEG